MNWFWIVGAIVAVLLYIVLRAFRGSVKNSAVQNAFLAKHTYDQLTDQQKRQVQTQTLQIISLMGLLPEDLSEMSEMLKFSFYALAMSELGIAPALPKEEWHYVKNPYMALNDSEHQVEVVKHHLERTHKVKVDLEWRDPLHTLMGDKPPIEIKWCKRCTHLRKVRGWDNTFDGLWASADMPSANKLPCDIVSETLDIWKDYFALPREKRSLYPNTCPKFKMNT